MAHQYNSQYHQQMSNLPPVQTHHPNQRTYSPSPYQQSPGAMSPGGVPPAKRQRLSPNPPSPYPSPYPNSPYATSPPNQYLSLPGTPAAAQSPQSFHQPQSYNHHNPPSDMFQRPAQGSGSMPPPKMPYSKTQGDLEKANRQDTDINNISDVLTGAGIDLRAEEDNLLPSHRNQNQGASFGNSFNSQTSSTVSPQVSFNQWTEGSGTPGAFRGQGTLSHPVTGKEQEVELISKHERAARALAEASQSPLTDPFLFANKIRQKISHRAYEHGIGVNLEGLFDKIPDRPQNVSRTSIESPVNGESIAALQADSLLNKNASFVEVLTLLSLAAEERVRTVLEDAFAMSRGRQTSAQGVVPPILADIAAATGKAQSTTAAPQNISKTAWEVPESAISPMTVLGSKQLNSARLPTPPTDVPPTPQPTISFTSEVVSGLVRAAKRDLKFEEERVKKRQKRLQASTSASAETPAPPQIPPLPEKMTKKERDRINKLGQTDDVLHRKANETAGMALGGFSKKYSWMLGGGAGGGGSRSGTSTPNRINTNVGAAGVASGTATPAAIDRALIAKKREYGAYLESEKPGKCIQMRDVVHVLETDGKEKKTLVSVLARLKSTEEEVKDFKDSKERKLARELSAQATPQGA
ncbi:hypothetical protein K469DRAFT_710467 [Zopfia rhizophila CBS 207.26]|uniref:Transcription initiation factor TFIID subunit 4 n=1 Tax=Zopfia rhizophila CBS 207.26 TaxID=1314779 RepID=A0A6A6DZF3_9PEZI|nr:hypothetical protein K469DRAFT_710467 [Zopfia rhizophila CBS 207.26]